jgi:hypothetical protein
MRGWQTPEVVWSSERNERNVRDVALRQMKNDKEL